MSPREIAEYVQTLYPPGVKTSVVPYSYTISFAALTAGATLTGQIPITANADFVHVSSNYRANIAFAAQTVNGIVVPLIRILITDSGTNEQFMNAATDITAYCSSFAGQYREDHSYPRVISGRSSLTVQVTSYEASNAYNLDFSLNGVLVRVY
jgi:hypothetical protein